jgi:hypothetical protein
MTEENRMLSEIRKEESGEEELTDGPSQGPNADTWK